MASRASRIGSQQHLTNIMKQRITYVVKKPEEFSPEQLDVKTDQKCPVFTIKNVDAAKEHRITLGLDELPDEVPHFLLTPTSDFPKLTSLQLSNLFQQWHELHIRWTSPLPYTSTPPFTSRVSAGLHIFFTPLASTPENALCNLLLFPSLKELKCSSTSESAIKLPMISERFSMSTSHQYYAFLDNSESMSNYFVQALCGEKGYGRCANTTAEMMIARYIDVDYDTISRAVVVTAGWPGDGESWTEEIGLPSKDATVEIGVLSHEGNADPEDIQFGGFLTVLGEDERPSMSQLPIFMPHVVQVWKANETTEATRFQTPTRHYPLLQPASNPTAPPSLHPLTYTTSFRHPTGLHPTLTLTFPAQHLEPPDRSCKLHTYLTLPSYLFIDRYQFSDALFLRSKNLRKLRSLAGATDLEAPDWVISQWGSAALFELSVPKPERMVPFDVQPGNGYKEYGIHPKDWNVSIPLHLRYLPASPASHTSVPVPWPVVFWACRAEDGGKHASNPFDRKHLGYESLFGPKTRFLHVEPGNGTGQMVEWIKVPVLDTRKAGWVEAGTVGTVVVAFLGLCWVLFGGMSGKNKVKRGEGKKTQ
jgi:hypothetical protein